MVQRVDGGLARNEGVTKAQRRQLRRRRLPVAGGALVARQIGHDHDPFLSQRLLDRRAVRNRDTARDLARRQERGGGGGGAGGGAGGDGGLVVGNDVAAERLQAAASGHLDEQRG
jgi:hypothetical protein